MAECIVCKGEYVPTRRCPRCGANNGPWEEWQQNHSEEQGGWRGLLQFAQPHIYLPFIMVVIALGSSLLGLGGAWEGVQPGIQLLAVIITVGGCLLTLQANYESRHTIREQMLLVPLLRGRWAFLRNPRTRAIFIPALTILLVFLLVAGTASSPLLREFLCWLVFDPNYCKEDPGGPQERVAEALPLIVMLCSCGFLIAFSYSSSLLLAMRYANEMTRELPLPIFLDDNRLADVVRNGAGQILSRPDGLVAHIIGHTERDDAAQSHQHLRTEYARYWNWSEMERTPDGGIRMRAYILEREPHQTETVSGLSQTQRTVVTYVVTADPWGRIRRIQRCQEQQ